MAYLVRFSLLLSISLAIWGCDNSEKQLNDQAAQTANTELKIEIDETPTSTVDFVNSDDNQDSNPNTQSDTPIAPQINESQTPNPTETDAKTDIIVSELAKKYQNKPLTVLDSSETILDGSSTLVVTFSVPLAPKQNFDNLVRLVDEDKGAIDSHWELSSSGLELHHRYLEPKRKLHLGIDKMLMAVNDARLESIYKADITTRDRTPMVGFSSSGSLLPSQSMKGLPITTLNIDKIDVNFYSIKSNKIYDFMQNYGAEKQLSVWNAEYALGYSDLVYSARFDLSPKPNVQETVVVDLSDIDQLKPEGTYIAVLNQAGAYKSSNPMTVFSISNIGIAIHAYDEGKYAVFTHRLDNGNALSDIKLEALCSSKNEKCVQVTAITNKQGYAELRLDPEAKYKLITASDNKQMSFVNIDRNALDLSEFNVSGGAFYQKQLFTFGARDLYRPEENVYLNALLRNANGKPLPNQPIKAEIISPTGQVIKDFVWKPLNKSVGFYQTRFTIPANAATGKWSFKFNLGDDVYRYHYFSVEEFLPERMAVILTPTSTSPILTNNSANFTVKGWYLYGAPASGNALQAYTSIAKERTIEALPDFKIGSITEKNLERQVGFLEQTLNNQGIVEISIDKQNWQDIKSPIKAILQTSVLDVGGRPVTRTISQSIWPAEHIPAVRALFAESRFYDWSVNRYVSSPTIDYGSNADFEIAYIDAKGNKFASNSLVARFVKEKRDYYWTWSDSDGWQVQCDQKEFVVSEEKITVAENGVVKISFTPDDWGSYRIEVVDKNSKVKSSIAFWNGYSWQDNTGAVRSVRPDQVKLSLDKSSYRVGDTARVHVQAPVSGSGYISLETNNGTLWMKEINVPQEGMDVNIPIKDWGRHDIYLNAMVIRPSTDTELQTIKRAIGLLYLPIDTKDRELKLDLDLPVRSYPEKTVKVKVSVPKEQASSNDKITVLLSAVDNGVLNITNFETPDPYSAFLGRKRYDVEQFDVYGKLIEGTGRNIGLSFGGDSNMLSQGITVGGKKPLTDIKILAQQLKTVTLNSSGQGETELIIPDFNGELRIMAQAWDDVRFGQAEKNITIAAPVIAELSTPRFLSGGDKTVMAFELRNLTEIDQNLTVNLVSEGLINLLNDQVFYNVKLLPQEHKIIQIPATAEYGFGTGKVVVNVENIQVADSDRYHISRSWNIGVRPTYPAATRLSSALLNVGEGWSLSPSVLTNLIDNTVESELVISHNLPFNIARYIKSLEAYPYGCLEQTISRLYPSLYANEKGLAKLGIKGESDDERRKKVQLGIDRIFGMQRNNGSFGFWNKESNEECWLTVYAVEFLLKAQERGYQVNQQGLNKALERLSQYLYDPTAFYNQNSFFDHEINEYTEFATKSYAALILASQNKVTPAIRNEIKRLHQRIKSNQSSVLLSPLPIMQLSIAANLTGNKRTSDDLLDIAFSINRDNQYHWLGDYGSVLRDKAQMYNLMVEYKIEEEEQAKYLLKLSSLIKNVRYLSTQELNSLFIASWVSLQERKDDNLVVLFNSKDTVKAKETIYRTMNYNDLANGISIHNPYNAPPLYILFSLSGYTKTVPEPTPESIVLSISRQYFDTKGKPVNIEELNVGDLVVVVLDVRSRQILYDALVVDLLPAGFELENPNLSNSSVNIQSIPELADLLINESSSDIKYQEYRDDRYVAAVDVRNSSNNDFAKKQYRAQLTYLARAVTTGEYGVPAPFVESMYKPEWFAIGSTPESMTIKGK